MPYAIGCTFLSLLLGMVDLAGICLLMTIILAWLGS